MAKGINEMQSRKQNWKSCMINLLAVFSLCCGNLTLQTELHQGNIWFVLLVLSPCGKKVRSNVKIFYSFKCHHVLLHILITIVFLFITND